MIAYEKRKNLKKSKFDESDFEEPSNESDKWKLEHKMRITYMRIFRLFKFQG